MRILTCDELWVHLCTHEAKRSSTNGHAKDERLKGKIRFTVGKVLMTSKGVLYIDSLLEKRMLMLRSAMNS